MTASTSAPAPTGLRVFNMLVGLTSLGILLQAITAGEFVSQHGRHPWIAAHNIIATITIVVALATMIVGIVAVRRVDALLNWLAIALFVLLVVQTVLGHLITDSHADGLIGVHVPVAVLVFGLAVWLSIRGAAVRRRSA
jgi:hypothetical protein